MRILIIGPSWVGDMVMSQSFYRCLKIEYPDARIDVLAPNWCKPILARMPEINQAIEMPIGHGELNLSGRWKIAQTLRTENYSHAFVLPNSAKSALIPWFAGIKKRTGWKGEMRYGLLNDLRPNKTDFEYMVERYAALAYDKSTMKAKVQLDSLPKPYLNVDAENQARCLAQHGFDTQKPIVGICPGAEFGPAKRWPEKYYAQVAEFLIGQGKQVCLFGGPKDAESTAKIRDALPAKMQKNCFDLAGKTALVDVIDLLAACERVISNDSGLMHIAAAVGCELITIYGSTSPRYTPPLTDKAQIVHLDLACRPCFKRECPLGHLQCLEDLLPEKIIALLEPK